MRMSRMALGVAFASLFASSVEALEVERHTYSEWTRTRFSESVTVKGPGKFIFLAGVGAEDHTETEDKSAAILHLGDPYKQCVYAYEKIKTKLADQGATLADVVKQVVYVNDIRYQGPVAQCRREAYGDMPIPANTFLVVSGFAIPGMLLEIDVTAVVPE